MTLSEASPPIQLFIESMAKVKVVAAVTMALGTEELGMFRRLTALGGWVLPGLFLSKYRFGVCTNRMFNKM